MQIAIEHSSRSLLPRARNSRSVCTALHCSRLGSALDSTRTVAFHLCSAPHLPVPRLNCRVSWPRVASRLCTWVRARATRPPTPLPPSPSTRPRRCTPQPPHSTSPPPPPLLTFRVRPVSAATASIHRAAHVSTLDADLAASSASCAPAAAAAVGSVAPRIPARSPLLRAPPAARATQRRRARGQRSAAAAAPGAASSEVAGAVRVDGCAGGGGAFASPLCARSCGARCSWPASECCCRRRCWWCRRR